MLRSASGNVVRYVGLYHCNRGAHTFFLRQGTVARPGSYLVNLLHYEDAASMAVAALAGDGSGGKVRPPPACFRRGVQTKRVGCRSSAAGHPSPLDCRATVGSSSWVRTGCR